MSKSIAVFVDDSGRYSVATSAGIVCSDVTRANALAAMLAKIEGMGNTLAGLLLDSPVSAAEFRGIYINALAAEIESLENAIDGMPKSAEVAEIHRELMQLKKLQREAIAGLQSEVAAMQAREAERARAAEFNRLKSVLIANGESGDDLDAIITQHMEKHYETSKSR